MTCRGGASIVGLPGAAARWGRRTISEDLLLGRELGTVAGDQLGKLADVDVVVDPLHRAVAHAEVGAAGMERIRLARADGDVVRVRERGAHVDAVRAVDGARADVRLCRRRWSRRC